MNCFLNYHVENILFILSLMLFYIYADPSFWPISEYLLHIWNCNCETLIKLIFNYILPLSCISLHERAVGTVDKSAFYKLFWNSFWIPRILTLSLFNFVTWISSPLGISVSSSVKMRITGVYLRGFCED